MEIDYLLEALYLPRSPQGCYNPEPSGARSGRKSPLRRLMSNCGIYGEGAKTLCCWYRTFAQRWWCPIVDLDSFLPSSYVSVDDCLLARASHYYSSSARRRPARPALLADSEVLTLAIPSPSSGPACAERARLLALCPGALARVLFPTLSLGVCTQGQFDRRGYEP